MQRSPSGTALAVLILVGQTLPANAAEVVRLKIQGQPFEISVDGPSDLLPLNKMTSLTLKIVAAEGQTGALPNVSKLVFDARMPAHNHGMVVKPVVTEIQPNEFRVEGVKLHMAGAWQLSVTGVVGQTPFKAVNDTEVR